MILIQIPSKKSIEHENYWEIYDFHRLLKVKEDIEKRERANIKTDRRKMNKLREPLDIGEKVLVLAERSKKKDALDFYTKSQHRTEYFKIKIKYLLWKRVPFDNSYYYWIFKDEKRYIRQELFALNSQFV